jgi:predicted small lipoprotein YifL
VKRASAILAAAVLLAACGQRGPLYLPDQAPPKKRLASAAASAASADSSPSVAPAAPVAQREAAATKPDALALPPVPPRAGQPAPTNRS